MHMEKDLASNRLLAGSDGLREPDLLPQGQHLVREDVRQTESGDGRCGRSVARHRCRSDGPSAPASLELELSWLNSFKSGSARARTVEQEQAQQL